MAQAGALAVPSTGLSALNRGTLKSVLLARLACAGPDGLTRAGLRRDLAPLIEHRLSPAEWRRELDQLLLEVLDEGLVESRKARIVTTARGRDAASSFLGYKLPESADWANVRDVMLVARALGLEPTRSSRRKRLASALGLRGAILEAAFHVPAGKAGSAVAVRNALARAAGRARGGQHKRLEGRRAAEQLLHRPRSFESDEALVAELAAEQVGAVQTSAPSLRLALIRKLLGRAPAERRDAPRPPATPARTSPPPVAGQPSHARMVPPGSAAPPRSNGSGLPDIATFAGEVLRRARDCAEGWAGNRRAFVSKVWQALSAAHPGWGLEEQTYKQLLVEAHKSGLLTLAYADLRDKANIAAVEASAIRHRNAEWHFIRVDD